MTTKTAKSMREGFHTVTPYVTVREVKELIEFIQQAFGATGSILGTGSAGGLHAEFKIGDSMVMIGGGEQWRGTPMPASLHLYVKDADAVYEKALRAGAKSLYKPMDQPYGDREAGVQDLCGNQWWIATHKATGHAPRGFRALTPGLRAKGAAELIAFVQRAFGGEEISRTLSPGGEVAHAEVRIGDSMVEVGEAHGPFQPMPMVLLLYVDDVDSWYHRAVGAGGAPMSEPADQPYGDRTAAVADAYGNQWYVATPIREISGNG